MSQSDVFSVSRLRLNCAPQFQECAPGWSWRAVPLPDHDFWFVASGRGEMRFQGRTIELHPGVCFIWRPGDAPHGLQDPQHRLTVFFCHFDPLDEMGKALGALQFPSPMVVRDLNFFISSAHRAQRLWQRGDEAGREQAQSLLVALLWQLWDESQNEVAPADASLEELVALIRSAPEKRWNLDDMARQAHLSRARFTRRFRAAFRASPAQFVIQTRVDRARQLLLETDMTLEQIARALGYADAYFFARQFKQITGQNPGELRRRRQSSGSS